MVGAGEGALTRGGRSIELSSLDENSSVGGGAGGFVVEYLLLFL